ncbi:MAG: hypothetical protein GY810_20630 [Aureispira sp.]|nr:hypothetical protein [Aureispira sp.]
MNKSKLVEVFYSLDAKEITKLRKFLLSPYFNKREDVWELFQYLCKTKESNRKALEKEQVHQALYPNSSYDDGQIRYAMSFLFKLIEQFLVIEDFQQQDLNPTLNLARVYRKRGLTKHFQQTLNTTRAKNKKKSLRDIDYLEYEYQIESEAYFFSEEGERTANKNLQELNDILDIRFIAQKLKQGCTLLAHERISKIKYNKGILVKILEHINDNIQLLEYPSIALYYFYYQATIQKENKTYFEAFKEQLTKSYDLFSMDEMRDLYRMAINYSIRQTNIKTTDYNRFLRETWELYKVGIQKRFLFDHGYLSHFTFKNVVNNALGLKEFSWLKEFIEVYSNFLHQEHKESYLNYGLAQLSFRQKKYKEALSYLQILEGGDLYIKITTKVMYVQIYYVLEEDDVLDSSLASFGAFVNRKDNLNYSKEYYKNFIRFTKKLINVNPFDKQEKALLLKEIQDVKALAERSWLLEQLQNL